MGSPRRNPVAKSPKPADDLPDDYTPPNKRTPKKATFGYVKRRFDDTKPPLPESLEAGS